QRRGELRQHGGVAVCGAARPDHLADRDPPVSRMEGGPDRRRGLGAADRAGGGGTPDHRPLRQPRQGGVTVAALHLTNISKKFAEVLAVDDLSLEVADGEFVVLLGPSGCGKTTTLRMIPGFIEASAGAVRIGARDVTQDPPYRRNVGFVFQNYA